MGKPLKKEMMRFLTAFILTDDDLDLPILGTADLIDGARVCVSATAAPAAATAADIGSGPAGSSGDGGGGGGGGGGSGGGQKKAASKRELEEMRQAEIARVQSAIAKEQAEANRDEVEKFSEARANVRRVREAYNRRTRARTVDAAAAAEHARKESGWLEERARAIAAARGGELAGVSAARERLPAFEHRVEILGAVFGEGSGQVRKRSF
jgi:hypothetical protein